MANANTRVAKLLMAHDIDLFRFEAGMRKQVVELLDGLTPKLVGRIIGIDPIAPHRATYINRRVKLLVEAAGKDITEVYKEIERVTGKSQQELVKAQAATTAQAVNSTLTVELVSGRLNAEVVKTLATNSLVEGAPSKDWWRKQDRGLRESFEREIKQAVVNGETINDMVQRVRGTRARKFKDGIMATATRKAQALVRTSALTVANEARYATYHQNADVVKGVQWSATLDTRTTDICKALDGQSWYLDRTRMPGTELEWRGPPPAHWACRSTLIPVLKPWSSMVKDKKVARKLKAAEAQAPPGYRASMDGQVSSKLDYEDWLRTQPEARQLEVLGPTKHRLWKKGKLPFTQLVDQSHNPLTVEELKEKFK